MPPSFTVKPLPKLIFGPGTLVRLPRLLGRYGKQLLVVTGKSSFCASPRWSELTKAFSEAGFSFAHIQISGEPTPGDVDSAAGTFGGKNIDAVVAVGGGSVLDGGKAISAMLKEKRPITTFLEGIGTETPSGDKVPFIAVPTTSGTGSEATSNAVIREPGPNGFKKSLRHDDYIPDIALLDPELTLNCPPSLTGACGMDAYTQLVEGYLSTNGSPFTDSLAIEGIQALHLPLCNVAVGGCDLAARTGMAYGSYLSGVVLANAGLGTVHGFASVIGGYFDIPHGVVCGTLMAEVNRAALAKLRADNSNTAALEKYTILGQITSGRAGLEAAQYQDLFIQGLQKLTQELQIPGLSNFGITENDLVHIAEKTGNKYNPVHFSIEEMIKILRCRLRN